MGKTGKHVAPKLRRVSKGWITPLALVLSLVMGTVAWADTVTADADFVTAGPQTSRNLGTVSPGAVISVEVAFWLVCSGRSHIDDGQTVNFSYSSSGSSIPSGGSVTVGAGAVGPVPDTWPNDAASGGPNCPSGILPLESSVTQRSTLSIAAPLASGAHAYSIKWSSVLSPGPVDPSGITGTDPVVVFNLTVAGDSEAPQSATILINAGAAWTNSSTGAVTVAISATDNVGVTRYRLAETQAGLGTAADIAVAPAEASFSRSGVGFSLSGAEGSAKAVWLRVFDAVGNFADASDTIGWDKTAPTVNCDTADGLWHGSDVSVGCTASDGGSGLAVPGDADFDLFTTVEAGTETDDASTASHTVYDVAGNSSTAGPIGGNKVDKKAPTVNCDIADGLWHGSDVSVGCTASDGGSGLANSGDAAFDLLTSVAAGTETDSASTNSRTVYDAVGNSATAGPIGGNMVDKKVPGITITSPNGGPYVLGSTVAAGYTCADDGSGVASCSGPVSNGTPFDTSAVGNRSFTVEAADNVGNSSSATKSYQVVYATGTCLGAAGRQVLQPVNADGSSVFKKGSTVPIKFRVCDANNNSIGTPGVVSSFRLVGTFAGTITSVLDSIPESTTPDSAFRWSSTDQQWIYNLNTKLLNTNTTYYYEIRLNDGTKIEFQFGLK